MGGEGEGEDEMKSRIEINIFELMFHPKVQIDH